MCECNEKNCLINKKRFSASDTEDSVSFHPCWLLNVNKDEMIHRVILCPLCVLLKNIQ